MPLEAWGNEIFDLQYVKRNKFCCPQFISGKSTPNVSRYPLFDFLFTRTEVFTSNPLACSNISTRKQRLRLMFTNSLESYLQNQTSRRNSYCHLFTDIDMYSSLLKALHSSKQYKCSYVLRWCRHIHFSPISRKVIHENVFCSQTSARSWYSFVSPSLVCLSKY